jgi:hypothetical protein
VTDSLVLTDDEVVALAVARSSPWPSDLPTVDVTDPGQLEAAAFRGNRSLLVRGLLDDDGAASGDAAEVAASVLGTDRRLVVFLSDLEFRRAGWGLASSHHPSSTNGWLFEGVNALGLHAFAARPLSDHREYLEALLEGAVQAGPRSSEGEPTSRGGEWLCMIARAGADRAVLARARRDELGIGIVPIADGQMGELGRLEVSEPKAAVEQLTAAAASVD